MILKANYLRIVLISYGLMIALAFKLWILLPILGLIWLILTSLALANKLLGSWRWFYSILGLFGVLAIISIIGTIFYHLFDFGYLARLITILLITAVACWCMPEISFTWSKIRWQNKWLWYIAYYLSAAGALIQLALHQTVEAIRSPWEVLPLSFWLLVIVSTALLIFIFLYKKPSLTTLICHSFLFFSVAIIVYRLGYGYDPFIHLATEKYIADAGFILPKKIYYLGLYLPVVLFSQNFGWNLELVNRLFVPILAALTLPTSAWLFLTKYEKTRLAPLILAIPFTTLIMTTPQNLANLFIIICVFLLLVSQNYQIFIWLMALASLITQPITGVFTLALAILYQTQKIISAKYKVIFYTSGILIASLGLPLAFWLLSRITIYQPSWQLSLPNLSIFVPYLWSIKFSGNPWLNLIYFYSSVLILVILVLAIWGIWQIIKQRIKILPIAIIITALIVNALIFSSLIKFPFLINYEQLDFAKRLIEIAILLLLPIIIFSLSTPTKYWKIAGFLLIFAALISSFYLSYPRNDSHFYTKGFSVSQYDFKTVQQINEDAAGKSYVVLANQNLGAAALTEFGFINYRTGPDGNLQYFYSIPTGERLYSYFYNIAEKGDNIRPNIKKAQQDYGVDLVYLVINNYWWNKEQIKKQVIPLADKVLDIDNGKILVFRFST